MFDIGDVLELEARESEDESGCCDHGIPWDDECKDCEEEADEEVDE